MNKWITEVQGPLTFFLCVIPGGVVFIVLAICIQKMSRPQKGHN